MPLTHSSYSPPLWMRNGHLATIYSALLRRVKNPGQERERLELADGDFLDLDWSFSENPGQKVLILLHGLEGNAQRPYMLGSAALFSESGYDVCAVNLRGCSGEPNRLYRSYHSGATEDLEAVVWHVRNTKKYPAIFLKGFSLGGNLILKFLGEGSDAAGLIRAAAAISVPCDLHDSLQQLQQPKNWMYAQRFLSHLKEKMREKQGRFPERLSEDLINRVQTLKDFDDLYTSQAHGFKDALDYYTRCSCKPFLPDIQVPSLLLNAANDSFLGPSCYPEALAKDHPNLLFEHTDYGGHVGYYASGPFYYSESRSLEFLQQHS
jgi:predicted alpha/beta-fold hydrolase